MHKDILMQFLSTALIELRIGKKYLYSHSCNSDIFPLLPKFVNEKVFDFLPKFHDTAFPSVRAELIE